MRREGTGPGTAECAMRTSPPTPTLLRGAGQQEGVSVQASCWSRQSRSATHTALLHLKPLPKASCHTRSPRLTPCFVSTKPHAYLQGRRQHQHTTPPE